MSLKISSVSATSVKRIFPSSAFIFNWLQFVASWLTSAFNLVLSTLQYFLGLSLSLRTPTTSIIEKNHFSCSSSHKTRTLLSSNNLIAFSFSIMNLPQISLTYRAYSIYISQLHLHKFSFGTKSFHLLQPSAILSQRIHTQLHALLP